MPDKPEKSDIVRAAEKISEGLFYTSFMLFLGLCSGAMSTGGPSSTAMRGMGDEIGKGLAHAACIEARGTWHVSGCDMKDTD
ncbi:hypothetical protein [Puniceibacterium sp. IMCC21224]|uniref:hypothetical protein n=1 Tax=Puniceibacterium sp. IMCC21224 TaxID=1618204 RepID=UPI00064E00DC|nr:hypothetical protein [Puniceibacterium sp. IMCC21224]KMK65253.1 hypothetical protein IMCC21224_1184 [Puniceibacterium sp. IMCC21224]